MATCGYCKDCRWWDMNWPARQAGKCLPLVTGERALIIEGDDMEPIEVYTLAEFGCVQFQAKELAEALAGAVKRNQIQYLEREVERTACNLKMLIEQGTFRGGLYQHYKAEAIRAEEALAAAKTKLETNP